MKAAVLRAFGESPRYEDVPTPQPGEGEELIAVTSASLNNIDRVKADGTHYSVGSPEAAGALPAVVGVIGTGQLADGQRVLFGSQAGTMAEYALIRRVATFPIPDGVDDATAAAIWNPGLSAWLTFAWKQPVEPGQTVLILGATGVTGKLAVQLAKHFGAGRVIGAGRNKAVLAQLPELGADATISIDAPEDEVTAAYRANAGEHGYDIVVDYLWGRPTEILIAAIAHNDGEIRRELTRLVQVGEMAGPRISLAAGALRSTGLEISAMGTGTMPPMDVIVGGLGELLDLVAAGKLRIDVRRAPLSSVADLWSRDQAGRRTVFIP
ncbi:MAG TPA: zinc-binding alcohol dehydrogenase family protein [Streptosporangiaceae bacterium]|jgi:NADPH2:quinone reductase|nr:zinc-binding alcohol dehydrogenase family protein [Streptosporangiaceae bacterium]